MNLAIIQARYSSTRLPGKVDMDIAGKPMLGWVIERTLAAQCIDKVLVASTTNPEDKKVEQIADQFGALFYAGSESDVLDRYYQAAKLVNADVVVRVTGDCPLIDPAEIDASVELRAAEQADYASNRLHPTFPDGLDVDVLTSEALERVWRNATKSSDREHVITYIWNNPSDFKLASREHPEDFSAHRWTVDHPVDMAFMRSLFEQLGDSAPDAGWEQVLSVINASDTLRMNTATHREEGYQLSVVAESEGKVDHNAWIDPRTNI
jgi:spore coat polysaccharide biosynthesis protein SpsF